MYDMIHRDCFINVMTWLKEHSSHYVDIKLNEHWYSNIASGELSVQLDKNDNHITVTEDAVLNKLLQKNMSKEKLNKDDNQHIFTRQIESTSVETVDTESDDEDTELAEAASSSQPQARINR